MKGLLLILALTCLTSCYRMPTEDDYCVVPTTNNPDVTRERVGTNTMMPGASY